ncbi:MAG: radical SAM protein [Treponema sp.]|nr:radical SAM protein [Treponema sp.]
MHFKEVKGILSPKNGMNLGRGCIHGCIYCDSRSRCYHMDHDFEDVEIKVNAPLLLEEKLRSKRRRCMIGTGAMSDPYIPIDESLAITRACLEIIEKYGFGLAIQTKSNLILRDLDLLMSINNKAKCVVEMTLTTFDEDLCKIVEPNVCTTKERFETLKVFRDRGIKTVVWLCPILPFINDTLENIQGILGYCIEAGVYGILCFGMGLTLREGDREYFYQKLDAHFPGLRSQYEKRYGNSYEVTSPNGRELMAYFLKVCAENNIVCDIGKLFEFMSTLEEKTLDQKTKNVQMELF